MSIRIRESGGVLIALCAAETDAEPGDTYLDDAQHGALAAKFAHDWHGQTLTWQCPEEWAEMAKHKKRDAVEELNKWLAAQGIEAGTDETLQAAQPEGQEPGGVAMRPKGKRQLPFSPTPSSQDTDQ